MSRRHLTRTIGWRTALRPDLRRNGLISAGDPRGPPMPTYRRLAAVLIADVAGYSRLMGAYEERTLDRLSTSRQK